MEEKVISFRKNGKIVTKILKKEAIALRRLRIQKKIKREKLAEYLEVDKSAIERFENGYTSVSEKRVKKILKYFKITHENFSKILSGEIQIPDLPAHTVYEHKKEDLRRMYNKSVTKEARVLRVFRKMKGLSQFEAGELAGMHRRSIGHIENGRVEVTTEKVRKLLPIYSNLELKKMIEKEIEYLNKKKKGTLKISPVDLIKVSR